MILQKTVLSSYLNKYVSIEFLSKDEFPSCTLSTAIFPHGKLLHVTEFFYYLPQAF